MGAHVEFFLNSHLRLLIMGSASLILHQKFSLFLNFFWVSVTALFRLISGALFRVKDGGFTNPEADDVKDTKETEVLEEKEDEEEKPKFVFKFKYQTNRENYEYEPVVSESISSTATAKKYEFMSYKDSNMCLEKPHVFSISVKELYADSIANYKDIISNLPSVKSENIESSHEENKQEIVEKLEGTTCVEGSSLGDELGFRKEKKGVGSDHQVSGDVDDFLSGKDFVGNHDSDSDSDSDSVASSHEVISRFVGLENEGFLSDKDFETAFEFVDLKGIGLEKVGEEELIEEKEGEEMENMSSGYDSYDIDDDDDSNDIEDSSKQNYDEEHVQGNNNLEQEGLNCNDKEAKDCLNNSEKSASQDSSACDAEDSNGLEILWEHQELIEQLKMELKKVRATGLPTILEEDESPKIMEDLKPWKIDEKFRHEDRMGELHKFYRSYRERMRKFDILNYQKMYALGFLQSKDPLKAISTNKASAPALASLLSQTFLPGKRKKSSSDPIVTFIKELHSDLEMIYVGQMCLSWEILHWQYEKALEIWDSDPYGIRGYNEVAGEFQQFQVLMQRFIENEPFEGPRVQNYVKNRCVLRNLLQVPVIREDRILDKRARRKAAKDDENAITSDKLIEIVEESIRIYWRFVRADKNSHTVIQKCRRGTQMEPQDPTELELLTEVRTSLQKKEKKLKDILRSGNCILKKFKKNEEETSSDQVLYFFSQVDMKLVSRVLNMSKITTDQLIWCSNKLSKINFVSRKIHVESSFLLFPC